jgi:hypothetical protein
MTLCFPNPSRSFDVNSNSVFFWGYDSVIEISFHIEVNALQKLYPEMSGSEADVLQTFDASRERIYKAADKVYVRGGKGTKAYILAAGDF